jgi:hypothetical protein
MTDQIAHMASLIGVTTGEHLPSPYALCGAFRPPYMTTRWYQTGCKRCVRSRALESAKRAVVDAPEAARFEVTATTDLRFASVD